MMESKRVPETQYSATKSRTKNNNTIISPSQYELSGSKKENKLNPLDSPLK